MKHKVAKRVRILMLVVLVLIMIDFLMGTPIKKNPYLDRYQGYYIGSYEYHCLALLDIPGVTPLTYTRIWFLPFQKGVLLKKIKQDVNDILAELRETYHDPTFDYEISGDFRKVIIYTDNYDTYMKLENWRYAIGQRVVLYHNLRQNIVVPFWDDIVDLVYTGSDMP